MPTPKHPTTSVVDTQVRRARTARRARLEENPPPPMRASTVDQVEAEHPGVRGRLRTWIKRADAGDEDLAWLKLCIIRIGRSVLIDEIRFRDSLHQRTAIPPAPCRRIPKARAPESKGRS